MRKLTLWWIDDGKPGHRNQSLGLLDALAKHRHLDAHSLSPLSKMHCLMMMLGGRISTPLPKPQLVLGAGHATHLSLLSIKRAAKAKATVLMKPSLPLRWFDAVIVPEHDEVEASSKVEIFRSQGALNRVCPGGEHNPARGLILLGGPSRHFVWHSPSIIKQLRELVDAHPQVQWMIANSRRTPADLFSRLEGINAELLPWERCDSRELLQLVALCGSIWVTPDSVSMIYESLTSGARTGIFKLDAAGDSRVARGVNQLLLDRRIRQFPDWDQETLSPENFWEADRAARWLLDRFSL